MIEHDPFDFDSPATPPTKAGPKRKSRRRSSIDETADVAEFGTTEQTGGKKKRKTPSYNPKVREMLKAKDVIFQRVETYNAFSGKKLDLFGIGDWLYIDQQIVALQISSINGMSTHVRGVVKDPDKCKAAKRWIMAGGRIEFWGFAKNARGRFDIRQYELTLDQIAYIEKGGRLSWTG